MRSGTRGPSRWTLGPRRTLVAMLCICVCHLDQHLAGLASLVFSHNNLFTVNTRQGIWRVTDCIPAGSPSWVSWHADQVGHNELLSRCLWGLFRQSFLMYPQNTSNVTLTCILFFTQPCLKFPSSLNKFKRGREPLPSEEFRFCCKLFLLSHFKVLVMNVSRVYWTGFLTGPKILNCLCLSSIRASENKIC